MKCAILSSSDCQLANAAPFFFQIHTNTFSFNFFLLIILCVALSVCLSVCVCIFIVLLFNKSVLCVRRGDNNSAKLHLIISFKIEVEFCLHFNKHNIMSFKTIYDAPYPHSFRARLFLWKGNRLLYETKCWLPASHCKCNSIRRSTILSDNEC